MEEDMREHYENEFDGEAKLGNTDAQDKRKFFFDSLTSEVNKTHARGVLHFAQPL